MLLQWSGSGLPLERNGKTEENKKRSLDRFLLPFCLCRFVRRFTRTGPFPARKARLGAGEGNAATGGGLASAGTEVLQVLQVLVSTLINAPERVTVDLRREGKETEDVACQLSGART